MPDDFVAAKPSGIVRGFFHAALPFILPRLGVVGVDYDPADLARLHDLRHARVLLTPNHPTNTEPALLFHLSCTLRQPFLYLACREAFEPLGGLWGEVIRRVGAFSVVRGTADRASFRATREMLAQPGAKVVIFPEGEVYSQNDSLLPFHSGVFQLAFWALEDLRRAARIAEEPSLYIVPIALRYHYVADMASAIDASLSRLAALTGTGVSDDADAYHRLRAIDAAMLRSLEREYRLASPKSDDEDLTPRLEAIKEAILLRVAAAAGVALPKGETLPERMRSLIHVVETVTRDDLHESTPYDAELRRQQRDRARPLLRDLKRLATWIAVYDGYVRADPSPERVIDTIIRLERECFGAEKIGGPRRCRVRIGEPLDLNERWPAYESGRRAEVARVTRDIEARVAGLLVEATPPSSLPRLEPS